MKIVQHSPSKTTETPKYSMFQLANFILHDLCPPDNKMYLCQKGEDDSCDCTECWDKYLWWAVNGYQPNDNPYRFERDE